MPWSFINSPIVPFENAVTVFYVVHVLAVILSIIRVYGTSIAMPKIIWPLTCVFSTIFEFAGAKSFHIIFSPFTLIHISIFRSILPFSMLKTLFIHPIVRTPVIPLLFSRSIFQVIFPFTFIHVAILTLINALPIRFIILPISLVNIAVLKRKFSIAVSLVIDPIAFIFGAIFPNLYTQTLFLVTKPLSSILSTIDYQSDFRPCLKELLIFCHRYLIFWSAFGVLSGQRRWWGGVGFLLIFYLFWSDNTITVDSVIEKEEFFEIYNLCYYYGFWRIRLRLIICSTHRLTHYLIILTSLQFRQHDNFLFRKNLCIEFDISLDTWVILL